MTIIEEPIRGLKLLKPTVYGDHRGYFYESYNKEQFQKLGIEADFVQDNQSFSMKGVLRGLHFQKPPHAQGKLVRVVQGRVLDVVVDIRKNSPSYGKSYAVELSAENQLQLWIPKGFAHGFETLEDNTLFLYKCTDLYHPETEGSIRYNDPDLAIQWISDEPKLSEKDSIAPHFSTLLSPFNYAEL